MVDGKKEKELFKWLLLSSHELSNENAPLVTVSLVTMFPSIRILKCPLPFFI